MHDLLSLQNSSSKITFFNILTYLVNVTLQYQLYIGAHSNSVSVISCSALQTKISTNNLIFVRGHIAIPHSRLTKTWSETFVICLGNVWEMSHKAICTIYSLCFDSIV